MVTLSPAKKRLIVHWGEMGDRWGVNRTIAQVHALLHLSRVPLTAEEISETLSVARSNVSTSIRELQSWGLVRPVQTLGERRQQFQSVKDVWQMFRTILDQRKKREIDPTLQVLHECITELDGKDDDSAYARERLGELEDFFSGVETIYSELRQLPPSALRRFLKARGLIRKLLPSK